MDKRTFYSQWTKYLKSNFPEELIVFVESTRYKKRKVKKIKNLTVEETAVIVKELGNSAAFCLCNPDAYISRVRETVYGKINDEQIPPENIPEKPFDLNDEEILDYADSIWSLLGTLKDEVKKPPFLFIDIDLADQFPVLEKRGLLPNDQIEDKEGLKNYILESMTSKEKKELLENMFNLDQLVEETHPNLVLFSGNGLHIWYSLPTDVTIRTNKYEALFNSTLKLFESNNLLNGMIVDERCRDINRNLRLPFTLNKKSAQADKVAILYSEDFSKISSAIIDAVQQLDYVRETSNGNRKKAKGRTNPAELISVVRDSKKTSKYGGMEYLDRDERLSKFVKNNISFEKMATYCGYVLEGDFKKSSTGFVNILSPFREESNTSFGFNDTTKRWHDFGDTTGDYGDAMRLFLNKRKEELKLYDLLPTTKMESQLHMTLCAYLYYNLENSDRVNAKLKFPFLMKDTDEKTGKPVKEIIPGEDYYNNMLIMFDNIINPAIEAANVDEGNPNALIKVFIESLPRVYYFYEYNFSRKESIMASQPTSFKLALERLFSDMNLTIFKGRHNDVELYMTIDGYHVPFDQAYEYISMGEEKKSLVVKVESMLMNMNIISAPKLKGSIADKVYALYYRLKDLHKMVKKIVLSTHNWSTGYIKGRILSKIAKDFDNLEINSIDMPLTIVEGDRYIQFNNVFVKYESNDPSEIGEAIENTPSKRVTLMTGSIIDLRIPMIYDPTTPTPLFDKLIDFFDYDDNKMRKILSYFFGSILSRPSGSASRALFLVGSGKNGKSVLADVMRGLLTEEYISDKEVHDICSSKREAMEERLQLVGKLVNISSDSSGEKLDSTFKNIVTGDPVTVRALFKASRDVSLRAHLLVNCNRLPPIQGESSAYKRRMLVGRLGNVVNPDDVIEDLALQILEKEASGIWPWIIEQSKIFKQYGVTGFLTQKELKENEELLLQNNDLYDFVEQFVHYDDDPAVKLTKTQFRRMYNAYRKTQDRKAISTNAILFEAATFIKEKFFNKISAEFNKKLEKGFDYKDQKTGGWGLPGLYVFIPAKESGDFKDRDSRATLK